MGSDIQVTGLLGPAETQTLFSQKNAEHSDERVANVLVSSGYPKTGEESNQYLVFSGICILLLLLVLRKRKTVD